MRTAHDGVRCYPGSVVRLTDSFANADCTVPAIPSPGSEEPTVAIAREDAHSGQLPVISELRRVGRKIGNTTFVKRDGTCLAAPQKQDAIALEGAAPWDAFARLEERLGDVVVP